ncbi:MAG: CRISPR-associated endonuclease Cas1 [Bifidobacteriaceae bacterium]|jgi:CRISPR-associated protein Cas1|nr:CRISPR-associated endonuclease Cas1 [Bifidobacteriaceae bacterium]
MSDHQATERGDAVTISLVAHHEFCPRRAWLEAAGERTDTRQMAVGVASHAATDDPSTGRRDIKRAVDVAHLGWSYTGRCDTIEVNPDGSLEVVEYKATPVRRRTDVTQPMRTQLALQVAALIDMGERVHAQYVYFTEHKRRVEVELSDIDFERARAAVEATRTCVESDTAPQPLEDDPKCTRCSHASVCLPDERKLASIKRRIVVADPDTQIVHLATPGSRAFVRSGRMIVATHGEEAASIPLERVQGVAVHGNVDLTGGLIRELLWRGLSIVWCTSTGRVVGDAASASGPNGSARALQYASAHSGRLDLAQEFVASKVSNQATFLRRNGNAPEAVARLRSFASQAADAPSVNELLGVEGAAAGLYFGSFGTMLRAPDFEFSTRSRRPAHDPVNAALNYAYALLLGDCIRAVRSCGLDPHAGFLHSSNRNKPALALDLAEEFRAPVADSAVVRALNNGELRSGDFQVNLAAVNLTDKGRKALIAAYERRVSTEFVHPTFDYSCSWRRAIEIQARLVLGVLDGTQDRYIGVRTR